MKIFKYIGDKILMLLQGVGIAIIIILCLLLAWAVGTITLVLGGGLIFICLLFFLVAGLFMTGDLQVVVNEMKNDE